MKMNTKSKKKLTKAERRVAVAKDVLLQIKAKRYKAAQGTYTDFKFKKKHDNLDILIEQDKTNLQTIIKEDVESCKVCALGSMFVSMINKENNFNIRLNNTREVGTQINSHDLRTALENLFSEKQQGLIESAFEKDPSFAYYRGSNNKKATEAANSYKHITKAEDCLIAIMKNIIKNKGTFVIS